MNKLLILFHGHCMDGLGAAWAAWRCYGDAADYQAVFHSDPPPDVTGRKVFLLDICYPHAVLDQLAAAAESITILDHHVSARDALAGRSLRPNISCNFDMNQSGAALAWYHFHAGPLPWILDYVQDRDLWRNALPHSAEVNAYLQVIPKTFESFDHAFHEGPVLARQKGEAILLVQESVIAERTRHVRYINLGGSRVPIVNHTPYAMSDLLAQLAHGYDFAVGYWQMEDGRYAYAMRSRGGYDVSALAVRYGGGGHRQAAGFSSSLPPDQLTLLP